MDEELQRKLLPLRKRIDDLDAQILDLLSLGVAVRRTRIVHDRQLVPFGERAHIMLRHIQQRTNERDVGAVEVGYRRKARNAAFIK